MALTILATNGKALLKAVGVPDSKVEAITAAGVTIGLTVYKVSFFAPWAKEPLATVQVGLSASSAIVSGKATPTQVVKVGNGIKKAVAEVEKAIEAHAKETAVQASPKPPLVEFAIPKGVTDFIEGVPVNFPKLLVVEESDSSTTITTTEVADEISTSATPAPDPEPTVAALGYPVFDKGKMKTAKVVPLAFAGAMYQPVSGTSPGSRYFMVGHRKGASGPVKLAARFSSGTLSIRAEGSGLNSDKSALNAAGFTGSGTHMSMHMVVTETLAPRVVAAVLAAIGGEYLTPVPDVSVITK